MPAQDLNRLDPSLLPGTHRTRVFVGGSYTDDMRPLLDELGQEVAAMGFNAIVADRYHLPIPDLDIHDVTLSLLHSCRLAIFDLSRLSGALMELERTADYGTRCLVLYSDPDNKGWQTSRMLNSFVAERPHIVARPYVRAQKARVEARNWLRSMKRMAYERP